VRSLLTVTLMAFMAAQCHAATGQLVLTVHVVHLLDETPVTGASVEIATPDGRVVARRSLDDWAQASFRLPSGHYVVRMASGYTGQAEIDLHENLAVNLEVIPVFRG